MALRSAGACGVPRAAFRALETAASTLGSGWCTGGSLVGGVLEAMSRHAAPTSPSPPCVVWFIKLISPWSVLYWINLDLVYPYLYFVESIWILYIVLNQSRSMRCWIDSISISASLLTWICGAAPAEAEAEAEAAVAVGENGHHWSVRSWQGSTKINTAARPLPIQNLAIKAYFGPAVISCFHLVLSEYLLAICHASPSINPPWQQEKSATFLQVDKKIH